MRSIQNPILPGFNPDPSILRVGDDYYIATSTFEWFPGVQIHHSKDLAHWRLLTRPLDRVSQLDMRGVAASDGVWAPCLSCKDGTFYLVYTIVRAIIKDQHNYVVTAKNIEGPWSEPVYLNALGFDPSLFHDDDGRSYLVQMAVDPHRPHHFFKGIYLTEYDTETRELIGETKRIFTRHIGATEGPHLYRRNGFYYLMVAEGGTAYDHAITVARSRDLWGGYEPDPASPMLTARDNPDWPLQRAGHGCLVETPAGEAYVTYLCSRPVRVEADGRTKRYSILGRETAIIPVDWTDEDWLRVKGGGTLPLETVPAPALPPHPFPAEDPTETFDKALLSIAWQTLRQPHDSSWLTLQERPGWLRLYGRESLMSHFDPSLIARRIESVETYVETRIDFTPDSPWQMAGLTAFYASRNHYLLAVSRTDDGARCLLLFKRHSGGDQQILPGDGIRLPECGDIRLAFRLRGPGIQFLYATGSGGPLLPAGDEQDATLLSDEHHAAFGGTFTGAFAGLTAIDLSGKRKPADFRCFTCRTE
ncbi:MAG: glycoside hydrolase family 43 protein [Verrucomicrobia bacterium]|nr:glycoside hydrolase family 43 protein [Verrucomicrobiota bacterium]MCH8526154.1 glycoside hydrolase family 43 protein [Kiritimatiellia bacterium]